MRTTALDPHLLSTPFEVQTNWHVLTGAPCTGKTTLIDLLADKGFQIVPESAREYFDIELAKGRTIQEIRQDGISLQRGIAALQLRFEGSFQPVTTAFLDRAIPDSLTFFRVFDMDPNEILPQCFYRCYATVFILDRLPFLREKILGPEDNMTSDFLDEWLVRDYTALGYNIIRVPVLTPQERLAYILERISERGRSRQIT